MTRLLFIFLIGIIVNPAFSQEKVDGWHEFAKTKFEPKYDEKLKEYSFHPDFPLSLKALVGKDIMLEGFYVPFSSEEGNYIILSKFPMSQCFFCGGGGPESIAEIYFLKAPPKFKVDDVLKVKGKLKLNENDPEHVNFILTEAALVK
jgi:hypothetical protein